MNKKDENRLNDYIDDPTSQPAPDPQTAQVVSQLRQQAEQVEPRPQFVQELSSRLQAEVRQSKSPRSFADWLVLRGVPRLVGATAVVGLIVLLAWGLPKLWQTWANPELEPVVSGDAVLVPHGLRADSTNPFPEVPAQLPLYQIEYEPIPATPEEAVAWATDFGILDPQAFTDPHQPGMIQVLGSNDESLTFQSFDMGIIYSISPDWYYGQETNPSTAEPLPFAEASDIAVNFLAAHGLLPAEYQVFDDEADGFESQDSLRSVSISPYLADSYTFSGIGGVGATINIAADGRVVFAFLSFANATPGEMVDIMPAQEAYAAYQAGELGSPGMETTGAGQDMPSIQSFSPPPPAYQVGDEVEVSGWPNVLVAANGGEVRATLNVYPPGTYHLLGDQVSELADIEAAGDMVVRGVITAVLASNEWELTVTDWEVGQSDYSSYAPFVCLKGAFSRQADGDWLTADEGDRYRVPDAPAELNEGDRIEVCTETAPIADAEVTWLNITQPPASEVDMAGSGMSVTTVEVAVEVDVEQPGPVPTLTMPEATSTAVMDAPQSGVDTVERSVVTAVGGTSGGGSFTGPIDAAAQYELGESVSLTGTIDAIIFEEDDGEQRYEVTLQLLDAQGLITATLPLSATAAVLQEVADGYYGRFLHVSGEIVPYAEWAGQAIAVDSFTAVWPEAGLQNFLGHMQSETVAGLEVTVFVDRATKQHYFVAGDRHYYSGDSGDLDQPQILLTGIIHPAMEVAGLSVLVIRSSMFDSNIAQAEDVSEFPLATQPQIIRYAYDPMAGVEEMVLERMELTYYFEPTSDYAASDPNNSSAPHLAAKQIARPMWVIHGRSPDGLTIYKIYVEATGK